MKCHQILTGAANRGDGTFGVGSVEGVPFTAYAAGCNLVLLSPSFERVQIVPGVCHNDVTLRCVAAAADTGKVAAAFDSTVVIYEPTPLREQNSTHGLDYWWVETARLECACAVATLAWNNEANRLITAGEFIQIWHSKTPAEPTSGISFQVGPTDTDPTSSSTSGNWSCLWRVRPANPVCHLAYAPDGAVFATAGKHDRLVRVWYQNQQLLFPLGQTRESLRTAATGDAISFSFIYLAHPRSVTGVSFRKTSKFMPKGAVANMLVTSCLDNVCRLWCETVLPEDGMLVNVAQLDPGAAADSKFRTHRQRARFIQRFRHMRQSYSARQMAKSGPLPPSSGRGAPLPIPSLPSTYSVHDFHNSFGSYHGTGGVTPALHFHLAGTINARTDIPLVPAMGAASPDSGVKSNFVLHWLNNKEMQFTMDAEKIMEDLFKLAMERDTLDVELELQGSSGGRHQETAQDHQDAPPARPPPPRRPPPPGSQADLGSTTSLAQSDASQTGSGGHHGSISSAAGGGGGRRLNLSDMLDSRIDRILKDWHQNSDLLFSVHPVDGSLLVWVADFMDEYLPGSFRQAQVSFSCRIPNALPLGDAMTMAANVQLFNPMTVLNVKEMLKEQRVERKEEEEPDSGLKMKDDDENNNNEEDEKEDEDDEPHEASSSPAKKKKKRKSSQKYRRPPSISLITKHSNGTLNLWSLMFAERSKFSQLLNISHSSRASGHRYRVNGITAHPVLPLLLTTSHHNILVEQQQHRGMEQANEEVFCSELILWRVDPIGPLSKSGGVSELARINSNEVSAFSDVAWIPTLLPSTTLGSISNSPSACFVASDGKCLRVYQAVIDARALLAELNSLRRGKRDADLGSASSVGGGSTVDETRGDDEDGLDELRERFRVVSTQSTAKPGAIIQLEAITDATQNWQSTLMLHAFQEQLILSEASIPSGGNRSSNPGTMSANPSGFITTRMSAVVDLDQQPGDFREPFYALVAEKAAGGGGVLMHMWRLVIASETDGGDGEGLDATSGSITPDAANQQQLTKLIRQQQQHQQQHHEVHVSTVKVCVQRLPLPEGVEVVHAVPAVGHLSSSSIYPACLAPYVMVTACSDGCIRFWRVRMVGSTEDEASSESPSFEWEEWQMESAHGDSSIKINGRPVSVSAAYSGRIAVAYQTGASYQKKQPTHEKDAKMKYVNLCVDIYECESTGGSAWLREDSIALRDIELQPEMPPVDLEGLMGGQREQGESLSRLAQHFGAVSGAVGAEQYEEAEDRKRNIRGLVSVPSLATLEGVKRYISRMGNSPSFTSPKQSVMLDWVSNEDGSHLLTVAVGNRVLLLTAVSSDISQASMKALGEARASAGASRPPLLRKSSSMGFNQIPEEIRWMQIRRVTLRTADGLNPTPMAISWARDGVLMCAMDNEIAVYSQWKEDAAVTAQEKRLDEECAIDGQGSGGGQSKDIVEHRNLKEADILNLATESQMRSIRTNPSFSTLPSSSAMRGAPSATDVEKRKKGPTHAGSESSGSDNSSTLTEVMPDFGLFEAAHIACPVLPQYHPKQLMELLSSGKIRWVKAILGHLVRCIGGADRSRAISSSSYSATGGGGDDTAWSRSRTLSVAGGGPGSALSPNDGPRGSSSAIPEEVTLDYAEINSIPPLPLWTLLAADKETGGGGATDTDADGGYDDLFQNAGPEENLDSILEEDFGTSPGTSGKKRRRHTTGGSEKQSHGLSYFGPRQARVLSKLLTHAHLPGLASLDQMHLLALADTVASCQLDLADRFAIDAAKRQIAKTETSGDGGNNEPSPESLDDCGLRFLLAMKHFAYLKRCLPLAQRKQLQRQGIGSSYLIWGYHSESEEELLGMIPSVAKGNPTWPELRELGVAWWIRNNTVLRKLMEKVAKTAFQSKQDPLDAAVYYLAMKKKSLVWGLYRSVKDERMTQFFVNDFSQERWRKAALKNAFALLGKQRFLHAAAFFLLSGSLKDAVDICIDKLDDLQLAMVIARLYEGEMNQVPESLQAMLHKHILGRESEGEVATDSKERAHPDPFLRSMALWSTKEYSTSLATLVEPNVGTLHPKYTKDDDEADADNFRRKRGEADPSVFNFYIYLRTHPLIARHQIAARKDTGDSAAIHLSGFRSSSKDKDSTFSEDSVTPLERRLYFSTAHFHLRGGCPALAVEVLSKLPNKVLDSSATPVKSPADGATKNAKVDTGVLHDDHGLDWSQPEPAKKKKEVEKEEEKEDSGFDWGAPVSASASGGMDWSQPVGPKDDDELKLEWSEDEPDSDEEEKRKSIEKERDVEEEEEEEHTAQKKGGGILDIMAQQLKFIACLKIMMEELSTLATGFEVDGGVLRYQLYIWLEREVEALKQLCNYGATDAALLPLLGGPEVKVVESDEKGEGGGHLQSTMRELFAAKGRKPTLHEVMLAEKADFQAKLSRANRRKRWLRANQTLLRTLLSYCGLHGANGGGLASVRMELILLLQELQQERATHKQLQSPLPFPTALPLLSACVAQQKTVVTDPVKHLQAAAHDMLLTLVAMRGPPMPGVADYAAVFLLRDLCVALSACIYQSLCDSDSINMKKIAARDGPASAILEALSRLSVVYQDSSLINTGGGRRKSSVDVGVDPQSAPSSAAEITTEPSKWPGVTSLRALLDREKDEETPNLTVLLCETFVAIYMSLLSFALASCDAQVLYRLVSQKVTPTYWAQLFGGGARKTIKVETASSAAASAHSPLTQQNSGGDGSVDDAAGDQGLLSMASNITKQRVKLNIKVLGVQLGSSQDSQGSSGGQGQTTGQERQSTREHFVAPEMSIVSKLMSKPSLDTKDLELDYDSGEESEAGDDDAFDEEDDLDPFSNAPPPQENVQHSDPNSYAWCLMRYACVRLAQGVLERFVSMAGIDMADLPVASPLIYASLRVSESWLDSTLAALDAFGSGAAPDNFIPGCFPDHAAAGPAIAKYRALFEPQNTPFKNHGHGVSAARRLWQYLVRQRPVQRVFVKCIFGGGRGKLQHSAVAPATSVHPAANANTGATISESQSFISRLSAADAVSVTDGYGEPQSGPAHQLALMQQPVKVIHKEHDAITAFCINKVSTGLMTLATQKELQELNVSLLLNPNSWSEGMNEEADFDVLSLNNDPESLPASNFLVIQTPGDGLAGSAMSGMPPPPPGVMPPAAVPSSVASPAGSQAPAPFGPSQSGTHHKTSTVGFLEFEGGFNPFDPKMKGLNFPGSQNPQFCRLVLHRSRHLLKPVKRHKVDGIRRLAAHSHLPLYVTGCQDGSVRMWEWSHPQSVQQVRPPGVFAKVNRVRFTAQGNKFGACDGDGNVSLWQASNATAPYFTYKCHSKGTSDYVYQGGCSSLVCTAGHDAAGKNVAIWDTLLPQKRCQVQSFTFHDHGASALLFAPQRNQLVSAGKRGQVSVWDLRQMRQVHFFRAHDQAVKCLAVDPQEEFFVTGSVAGDIKIWSMNSYKLFHTFSEEHCRQGIFKNISQGVSQVFVDNQNRLFSCGADGSMKVRQLPDRDLIVNAI